MRQFRATIASAGLPLALLLALQIGICACADPEQSNKPPDGATKGAASATSAAAKEDELVLLEVDVKEKRSPISATGIYGAGAQEPSAAAAQPAQFIIRQGDDGQEFQISPEYLALLQQYVAQQRHRQRVHGQHHQARLLQQHPQQLQAQQTIEQPLTQHQELEAGNIEQYHIETTSPTKRPPRPGPPIYYAQQPEHVAPRPQEILVPIHHHHQAQPQHLRPQPQQFKYHQSIAIRPTGGAGQSADYEGGEGGEAEAIAGIRAQANADAAALAFQKIAHEAHVKHQQQALHQIRVAEDEFNRKQLQEAQQQQQQQQVQPEIVVQHGSEVVVQQHQHQQVTPSALEQIREGEGLSEAGRAQRLPPKDPEEAYKARLKAQATALVAEQRRAQEQAEYKAHADAILKLQATQQAHLKAQEDAHRYALNFEKNQIRAQAQAQAIANAQALALYQAQQQARAKAQKEAQNAAKSNADASKADPDNTPVVQFLLPNSVPLPSPDVYFPKAQKLLEAAAHQQRIEHQQQQQQQQVQHQPRKQLAVFVEQPEEEGLRPQFVRIPGPKSHHQHQHHQQQIQIPPLSGEELAILVNAGYVLSKPQNQPAIYQIKKHQHQQQHPQQQQQQQVYVRPTQAEYLAFQESEAIARP